MSDHHQPKFRIEPTGPDFTTLILQARDEVIDDPEISHGAARMFVKILDLSVRQGSKGVEQPPGVVTVSQTKLHTWFGVSLRTIWNWKLELLEKGVVWMTSQPMPNAWPIDTYHITHLHGRKHSGDKTTAEGLWGNGARQSRPETNGMGARQPGQIQIPGTGVRSNPLRVATGFQLPEKSPILPAIATPRRNQLPACPETSCEPPPKPVATGRRNQLRRAAETDCEHKKAQVEGSSHLEGGSTPPPPPIDDGQAAFRKWEGRLDDMRNSDLRKVSEICSREFQAARTEPARALAKRKLVAVRLRLLGPSLPDEPGPVKAIKPATAKPKPMPIEERRALAAKYKLSPALVGAES